MKLVGICPVRNEDWCLGFTLRVALKWCDEVVVLVHASTDTSKRIVWELQGQYPERVHHLGDEDTTWKEMEHRHVLLELARVWDATHIAMIDADEFLTGNLLCPTGSPETVRGATNDAPRIRDEIRYLEPGQLMELPGYNLREKGAGSHDHEMRDWKYTWQYHGNAVWGNRWFATAFRDQPAAHWAGDRFHHREPMGVNWRRWRPIQQGDGGTLHLWGASERRLRAKHALYRVTERLRWPDKPAAEIERLYSLATTPREPWTFKAVPSEWLAPYADLLQYLHIDAEPWQESYVRSLLQEHGRAKFDGLDLLGL